MTIQEIKELHTMDEIARSYGFRPDRSGKIRCPFHSGDRHASLQLYKDHFHCFGCGAHGDVFDFVSRIEGIDFKTAFLRLGGTYKENPAALLEEVKAAQNRREVKNLLDDIESTEMKGVMNRISKLREGGEPEPYSGEWCELQEEIMKLRRIEDEYSERKKRK